MSRRSVISRKEARQRAERLQTVLASLREFAVFYQDQLERRAEIDKEVLARYARHVPTVDDLTLVVLKGHLLIEEMLTAVICSFLPHSEFVGTLRLTFERKLLLARALSWDQHNNRVWELIEALNAIRNDMAHSLESLKLQRKINNLRRLNVRHFPGDSKLSDEEVVRGVVEFCMGFLSVCIGEATMFRRWIQVLTDLPAKAPGGRAQ